LPLAAQKVRVCKRQGPVTHLHGQFAEGVFQIIPSRGRGHYAQRLKKSLVQLLLPREQKERK